MAYKLPSPVAASDGGTGVFSISTIPGVALISNGTSNQYFNPFQATCLFDDFITGSQTGDLGWTFNSGGASTASFGTTTDANHPGNMQITVTNIAGGGGYGVLDLGVAGTLIGPMILGGGAIDLYWVVQLPVLSNATNRYQFAVGLGNGNPSQSSPYFSNGAFFLYSDNLNSGNWQLLGTKASTATTTNSSIAATTSYTTLHININAAGTIATFYVNGVSAGTVATNLPTASVAPAAYLQKTASTVNTLLNIDLFYMYQSLTSPR